MLVNTERKPWSESGFQGAWGMAAARAGIRGLTFHDLRGTAVARLARARCDEVEINSITGHKPGDARAILTGHYLPRDTGVAENAVTKLNTYKQTRADQNLSRKSPACFENCVVKIAESVARSEIPCGPQTTHLPSSVTDLTCLANAQEIFLQLASQTKTLREPARNCFAGAMSHRSSLRLPRSRCNGTSNLYSRYVH